MSTVKMSSNSNNTISLVPIVNKGNTKNSNIKNKKKKQQKLILAPNSIISPSKLNKKSLNNIRSISKISTEGLSWLKLNLNPMGKEKTLVSGYPDGSAVTTTVADYTDDFSISFPNDKSSLFLTNANPAVQVSDSLFNTVQLWKNSNITLNLMFPPLMKHVAVVRIYPVTPTSFKYSTNGTLKVACKYPNWSAFDENGDPAETTAVHYLESWLEIDSVASHMSSCKKFRLIARGYTGIFTTPDLETQGFVTAAQMENSVITENFNPDNTFPSMQFSKMFVANDMNDTPAALTETYHNHYTNRACEGFYMPILSNSVENPFSPPIPYPIGVSAYDFSMSDQGGVTRTSKIFWRINDVVVQNLNTGVVWFESISPKFSLKIKTRSVLQYIPQSGSQLSAFNNVSPLYDPVAISTAHRLRSHLAHCYPSSYNDWGWLGDMIDAVLNEIPGVGSVYRLTKPVIKPVWNWLGDLAKDKFYNK